MNDLAKGTSFLPKGFTHDRGEIRTESVTPGGLSQLEQRSIRNVALLAHVDAGKTTTTEQMLFLTGRIRAAGSVDNGTTQTDWLDVERERGISVRMATTVLPWKETAINLVDTPGHVDFVAEVERSLQVLDGAVLVISAAEKVQSHTETLWHALRRLQIPTLLFVNKVDRLGVTIETVLDSIHSELTDKAVVLQAVSGTEAQFGSVEAISHEQLLERMADLDVDTLERYLEDGAVSSPYLHERVAALCRSGEAFPVLFGAANKGIGIRALLDAIVDYLPPPANKVSDPVSGVVFKLDRDPTVGRLAYVRLFGGHLQTRDAVRNETRSIDTKVTQVRKMYARHHEDVGTLTAGDIGVLCGLGDVRVGDILGDPRGVPPLHRLAVPVLTVQAHALKDADYPRLVVALQELTEEDPLLGFQWQRESRELHVQVMGAIQIEVLSSLLQSRFGVQARFDPPTVIYQETPAAPGEGFVAYTMPKPCWAILRFAIEPLPRGSGLIYSSQVGADHLLPSYQNEVARRVPDALQQGLLGWQVTDLRVTLTYGEHHIYHTHPLDFVVATPMGIMDGLMNTGTLLMEPLYGFRLSVPEEAAGRVLGDLVQMRARFDAPVISGGRFIVEGELPVATSLDYPVRLSSLTSGRGVLTTQFAGYQPAPTDTKATRDRTGVNPLDRAKYILSVRGAL